MAEQNLEKVECGEGGAGRELLQGGPFHKVEPVHEADAGEGKLGRALRARNIYPELHRLFSTCAGCLPPC